MNVVPDKKPSIYIIALGALGGGLSGGDRIFIEFARRWSANTPVHLYVWEEGLQMCRRENLEGKFLKIHLIKVGFISRFGFVIHYIYRILLGLNLGLSLKGGSSDLVYSASEFWMDSLPALIFKLRNPKVKWAAAWYQTAPNPLVGFSEGKRVKQYKLAAFLYWLVQKPIKPLISKFADFVLINNEIERKQFSSLGGNNSIVVLGAVNTEKISYYLRKHKRPKEKKYLGVFQGRFHPQKGVSELVDIWKLVVEKIPDAKLAMIGDGPLMHEVQEKVKMLKLSENIVLYGYLHDGEEKYGVFDQSHIVLHPAFYDSGGMASAEAMAFGLPCIGFDLKAYQSYYPKGMLKVDFGNLSAFAKEIISLSENKTLYNKISDDAKDMVFNQFSWDKRSMEVLTKLKK